MCFVFCVPQPICQAGKGKPKEEAWWSQVGSSHFCLPALCLCAMASCLILRWKPQVSSSFHSCWSPQAQPQGMPPPCRSLSPAVGVATLSLSLDFAVPFVPVTQCFQTGHLSQASAPVQPASRPGALVLWSPGFLSFLFSLALLIPLRQPPWVELIRAVWRGWAGRNTFVGLRDLNGIAAALASPPPSLRQWDCSVLGQDVKLLNADFCCAYFSLLRQGEM